MDSKITRRALAGIAGAIAASAGQQSTPSAPRPPSDQDVSARRTQMKTNFEQVSKVPLPISTEPATRFSA